MSAVATPSVRQSWGSVFAVPATVAFDSSYPTGGEPVTAAQFGLAAIDDVIVTDGGGYDVSYVPSTGKLLVRYADYDAVADGKLIEVPNTTNLSTLTARVIVIGS
jgi:hypothetical protein